MGSACRADSDNGSPSPAPCWPTSRSWCSTSRASTSTPRPPTLSTADLLALTEGRSTLLITHRLTGLEQVDEIIVLDGGQVVERGTHDDLLAAGGRYAGLWWEERMSDSADAAPRVPASPTDRRAVIDGTNRRSDDREPRPRPLAVRLTSIYHFLFVPVTIGLAFLVASAPDRLVPQRRRDRTAVWPASSARCCSSTWRSAW